MTSVDHLYLVRHGENRANLTKEFSHRKVDYSLTEKGRLQARQTAEFLSSFRFDAVWTSPLKRAAETASEIALRQNLPVQTLEALREMDVGALEGMEPLDAAWSLYADTMRRWLGGDVDHRFPQGESRRELCLRFSQAMHQVCRGGGRTLLVGHGGIFTHGVAELCGIEDQKAFFSRENYNCSITTIEAFQEGSRRRFVLVDWASVGHLSGEAALMVESVPESVRVKNL